MKNKIAIALVGIFLVSGTAGVRADSVKPETETTEIKGGEVSGRNFNNWPESTIYKEDTSIEKIATIDGTYDDFSILGAPDPVKVGKFEEDDFVYGLITTEGDNLTEVEYSQLEERDGWIFAEKADTSKQGILAMNGEEVIPFEYDHIDVVSSDWILCYAGGSIQNYQYDYNCDSVMVYRMEENQSISAEIVGKQKFFMVNDGYLYLRDDTKKEVAAYDKNLNVVGTASAGDVGKLLEETSSNDRRDILNEAGYTQWSYPLGVNDFADSFLMVTKSEEDPYLWGLINEENELILPMEYEQDQIMDNDSNVNVGYFWMVKDGKLGCVRKDGEITLKPDKYPAESTRIDYDINDKDKEGVKYLKALAFAYCESDSSYSLIAADGTKTTGLRDNIYSIDGEGKLWKTEINGKHFLMDWHGNFLFESDDSFEAAGINGNYFYINNGSSYDIYSID